MNKFRQIYCDFWENAYIQEELTPEDKLFYLYIMTNPKTTQLGVYSITFKQMAFDLGYSIETIKSLILRFEQHHKLIKYDTETKEIAVIKWGKNFNRGGYPMECCVNKEFKDIKNKELVKLIIPNIKNEKMKSFIENLFEDKKHENIDEANENDSSYDTSPDTCNDTGGISNKNNNKNKNNNNKEKIQENLYRLNDNPMEQDLIYKEFLEQSISEEVGMLIIDFLEVRNDGKKTKKQEVRELLSQLKYRYSGDKERIKALKHAIASGHKSLVYEEKAGKQDGSFLDGIKIIN